MSGDARSDYHVVNGQPWFNRESWPLHIEALYPYDTTTESGAKVAVDLATPDDDLCDVTTTMLHGLDRERQTALCIMPKGHDTPHMPQDEQMAKASGRLIIRRFADAQ